MFISLNINLYVTDLKKSLYLNKQVRMSPWRYLYLAMPMRDPILSAILSMTRNVRQYSNNSASLTTIVNVH